MTVAVECPAVRPTIEAPSKRTSNCPVTTCFSSPCFTSSGSLIRRDKHERDSPSLSPSLLASILRRARACAVDPDAGTCRGGAGEAVAELTLRARTDVLDAASDGRVVWVLTRSALERWSVDGAPLRTHEIALSGRGRALGARYNQVVVATDAGVQVVDTSGGGVSLGAPLSLCGRSLRVAHLRGSLWAVATTLGMGVVSTASDGAPSLVSMSALQPDPGGSGWAVPVDLSQDSWCAELDEAISEAQMNMLARSSAMASFEGRLLVARGPFVMNVDVSDPALPEALGTVATHITLERLRVHAHGGRAYGAGTGAVFRRRPVLDLRSGGFHLAGQHDVANWVERNDAAGLSIRLLGGTRVAVARVVR